MSRTITVDVDQLRDLVRAAAEALRALNRPDFTGERVGLARHHLRDAEVAAARLVLDHPELRP